MASDYAPAASSQNSLLVYCTSASAILGVKNRNKEEKESLRKQKKALTEELVAALERAGDSACIEVKTADGEVLYAQMVERKGARKRITPKSVVSALQSAEREALGQTTAPSRFVEYILQYLTAAPKPTFVMHRKMPSVPVRVQDSGALSQKGRDINARETRLKEIGKEEREAIKVHKVRCDDNHDAVAQHLSRHDPDTLSQNVKLTDPRGDAQSYLLRAKERTVPCPSRVALDALENTMNAEARLCPDGKTLLEHLQEPNTLARIRVALERSLVGTKKRQVNLLPS